MNAPRELSAALAREDLHTEAALRGETIGAAALRRCRDALDRGGHVSASAWRGMPPALREVLLTLCTDRTDTEGAALMPWRQLTQDERNAIGATARTWAQALKGAAWLR